MGRRRVIKYTKRLIARGVSPAIASPLQVQEIEDPYSFDPVLGVALVWVDVPQLGADAQQQVWMYYGNPKAQGADKGAATFDADYAAVYHFEDAAGSAPRDATAYANNAAGSVATVVISR